MLDFSCCKTRIGRAQRICCEEFDMPMTEKDASFVVEQSPSSFQLSGRFIKYLDQLLSFL